MFFRMPRTRSFGAWKSNCCAVEDISELIDQIFAFFLVFFVRDRANVLEVFQFEQFLSGVFFWGGLFFCLDFVFDNARRFFCFSNRFRGVCIVRVPNQIENSADNTAEKQIANADPNFLVVFDDAVNRNDGENARKNNAGQIEKAKAKGVSVEGQNA